MGPQPATARCGAWHPSPVSTAALTVVVGTEELLNARAVAAVVAAARAVDPQAEVVELPVAELAGARFAELTSPSLFGAGRVLVIPDVAEADKEALGLLAAYASDREAQTAIVGVHPGTKAKAALATLRGAGAEVVECPAPRWPEDRERFVVEEVRTAGGAITRAAAVALLAAVGNDLRELANTCAQLVADSGGEIDEEVVSLYHRGRADAGSFAIADRTVEGDLPGALFLLRAALAAGQSAAGITAALAGNLRTIAVVAGAGRGSPAKLAGELALPPWKVKKAQGWARGWHPDALARAMVHVALADAEVKGAAADSGYATERMVLQVASACRSR